jgi:hypothetical protein
LLRGHDGILSAAGVDETGWESHIWILNAMYETLLLPGGITHDEERRIDEAAGVSESTGNPALDEILSRAVATGGGLGRAGWPGAGWSRIRWNELNARLNQVAWPPATLPCSDWFPYRSWPANVAPPTEGSLDREQFIRLVEHLADASRDGFGTACHAYYALCATASGIEEAVYRCKLGDLPALYEDEAVSGSPSNFWPDGSSWFVYTDWDLWGTKVSGSEGLITSLRNDPEVETVYLADEPSSTEHARGS